MLDRARPRLADVDLRLGDTRDFDFGRTFDAVTCFFSSIGCMLTPEDLHLAAANMAGHLASGGVPWLPNGGVSSPR
jgi:hypothetical protein